MNEDFSLVPAGMFFSSAAISTQEDSADVFDEDDGTINTQTIKVGYRSYQYVCFGADNELPYHIVGKVKRNLVMSQNKHFNVLTCYGQGIRYNGKDGLPSSDKEVVRFLTSNSMPEYFLEQCTDIKYFYFTVSVIILSRDGKKIVKIRHKDACHCRFEKASNGVIRHVLYANWRNNPSPSQVEVLPLLDEKDPLGDLLVRLGKEPDETGKLRKPTEERKFAIVCKFPVPGCRYYPEPYYWSAFRDSWYDIYELIGNAKKSKLKNHSSVKYQVEVHRDYWMNICDEENIVDPIKRKERINKEKENIKNFVLGISNSGKTWITGYYIDPNGRENRMVRINVIDTKTEGGDWNDDIQEAANSLCYSDNTHPNLAGAAPGKGQSNNSGSDKRELFTLKQSLEKAYHDMMMKPHNVVIQFNGWADKVVVDIPMITLTTLDKHADAQQVSTSDIQTFKDKYDYDIIN